METKPLVCVIMGSKSDWDVMRHASETLDALQVEHEVRVLSAHRTPAALEQYLADATGRGAQVIIAAAGGAAHLAGVCAAKSLLPVLGVPMAGGPLQGMDALLSTVQMPAGIPVGTLAIGKAGAINAALLAVAVLAGAQPELRQRLAAHREKQARAILEQPDPRVG